MNESPNQEALLDTVRLAEEVVQGILKARKLMRIYPPNNPLYLKASEACYEKFKNFMELAGDLTLKVHQNELIFGNERVYHNPNKEDNLALFLFKDGIREITFEKGLVPEELEEFLNILALDFSRDTLDDDVVTLLWEKDLEHIKYVVDESLFADEEIESEYKEYEKIKENIYTDDSLKKAHIDALQAESRHVDIRYPISDSDLQNIYMEIKGLDKPRTDKLVTILFELLHNAKELPTFREMIDLIEELLWYCLINGDFKNASTILDNLKEVIERRLFGTEGVRRLNLLYNSVNKESYVNEVGRVLNTKPIIDENGFTRYIKHLDKSSIPYFLQLMRESKDMKGGHLIVEALSILGRHDIKALADGLNDERWEVVRDTIHILGRIGTSGALEYLTRVVSHPEEKVRKEVVMVIGNMNHPNVFQYIKLALNDNSPSVRITAARAMGNIKTTAAKKVLLSELSKKGFSSKDFNEKKEFYTIIAQWSDDDVKEFLIKTLKKKRLWNNKKNNETKACAAYALGMLGATESIPLLEKTSRAKDRLLKEYSLSAIKRLTTDNV